MLIEDLLYQSVLIFYFDFDFYKFLCIDCVLSEFLYKLVVKILEIDVILDLLN